jgi:hypothetical protein
MIVWVTRASTPDDPLLARRARITFSTWEDGPFDVVAVSEQAGPLTKVGIARTPVAASHLHATARRAQSLGFLVARSHDARKVLSDLQRFAGGIDQRQIVDAMDAVDAIAGVRYYDDGCTFAAVQFYSRRDTRWTRNFAELARDVRRISRDEVPGFLARRQTPKPVGRAR